jgi:phytoene dehydrogenase-like protein
VAELATPFTNERYTGNTGGSSGGFNFDGWFLKKPSMNNYYCRIKGIDNLYLIGHQTGYGGGLGTAFGSAANIAKKF